MAWPGPPAPARIETDRLVLRCYEPDDAPLLKDATDSSLDHLRTWMPWVDKEPETVEQKAALIEGFRSSFAAAEDFTYGIFDPGERRQLGGTGLHPRVGPGGLEIGYWIRADATRRGYATEVTAALIRVAFEACEADRVEIRIDPANTSSLGVPRNLGVPVEATLRRRLQSRPGEPLRDVVIHTLFREEYDPAIAPPLRAFGADGERLL
ncbi:MAG TPA: GNAT family N-acetyltransferase [Gaiellaceae bacterium]|nr:GNAT family N-acetyltransferase [Gaiellaceae bacterium]